VPGESNFEAYNAFNGGGGGWSCFPDNFNSTTGSYTGTTSTTVSGTSALGEWLQLQIPITKTMSSYNIYPDPNGASVLKWKVVGSNDGTTWSLIDSRDFTYDPTHWVYMTSGQTFTVTTVSYAHYRLICQAVTVGPDSVYVAIPQFNISVATPLPLVAYRYYKFEIVDIRAGTGFAAVSELLIGYNSAKLDYTGATVTDQNKIGSSEEELPTRAIDNNITTNWTIGFTTSNHPALIIDFKSNKLVNSYTYTTGSSSARDPNSFILYGSTDSTTWVTLDTQTNFVASLFITPRYQLPWITFGAAAVVPPTPIYTGQVLQLPTTGTTGASTLVLTGISTTISGITGTQSFMNGTYVVTDSGSLGGGWYSYNLFNEPSDYGFYSLPSPYTGTDATYVGSKSVVIDGITTFCEWITIKLPYSFVLTSYTIKGLSYTSTCTPKDFTLSGSNDGGITWK
jgi:hypothetical protein